MSGEDQRTYVWNVATGECLFPETQLGIPWGGEPLGVLQDGRQVICREWGSIAFCDAKSGKLVSEAHETSFLCEGRGKYTCGALSADGRFIVIGRNDGVLCRWDKPAAGTFGPLIQNSVPRPAMIMLPGTGGNWIALLADDQFRASDEIAPSVNKSLHAALDYIRSGDSRGMNRLANPAEEIPEETAHKTPAKSGILSRLFGGLSAKADVDPGGSKTAPCRECGVPAGFVNLPNMPAGFPCPGCGRPSQVTLGDIDPKKGINALCRSCGVIAFIPPSVWCRTCGAGLSRGWQSGVKRLR